VPQSNDPDSYYASRELIPSDMLGDLEGDDRKEAEKNNEAATCRSSVTSGSTSAPACPRKAGVLVDDGHNDGDLLHLIVEIKGHCLEDAKEGHHGDLLGARGESPGPVRTLGLPNSLRSIRWRQTSKPKSKPHFTR
jgi:hypothetical protein